MPSPLSAVLSCLYPFARSFLPHSHNHRPSFILGTLCLLAVQQPIHPLHAMYIVPAYHACCVQGSLLAQTWCAKSRHCFICSMLAILPCYCSKILSKSNICAKGLGCSAQAALHGIHHSTATSSCSHDTTHRNSSFVSSFDIFFISCMLQAL